MTHPREHPAPQPRPDHPRPRRPRPQRLPTFGLSLTSLIASGLAAITATIAASFLGVAGTVIGAAIFSVMTSIGKEVYDQSLRRTGHRVREVVPVTKVLPRVHEEGGRTRTTGAGDVTEDDEPPVLPAPAPRTAGATKWRRVAFSAAGLFAVVLAIVTSVEMISGRPVSDLVRGDGGSGTTFFGHTQVRTQTKTVPPVAPTMTVTVTPKVTFTTPTVTRTAPAVTRTNTAPTTPASSGVTPGATRTGSTPTPSTSRTP